MNPQRSSALWRAAAAAVVVGLAPTPSAGIAVAPYSGVPFAASGPLGTLPSHSEDARNSNMVVSRLLTNSGAQSEAVSAHVCDMGDQADKTKCLGASRDCMFARLESRDPSKPVQSSRSHCLPCRIDGQEMPLWNVGAWVDGMQVTESAMSCMHQESIVQPEYACSDATGFISQSQCFDKGAKSGSKCMFIAYEDKHGESKASCGPCKLQGSGGWGCLATGEAAHEEGSKVTGCLSQCDVLCAGPPACPPTVAPPPPPPPPSPGLAKVSSPGNKMVSAPAPFAMTTQNPYAQAQAIAEAAKRAGWTIGTPPPPKVYWPIVSYRQPMDYMFTTGPPPNLGPEPPLYPPKVGLLSSLRRRSWGQ